MHNEVSFTVNCADTRLGFHVRVVGSCSALGAWSPPKGLPLHTSAAEFPAWRPAETTVLARDEVIEYKYVICDNEGRPHRWEERPNRSMHLSSLAAKGILDVNGLLTIHEAFNCSCEPDECRFKAVGSLSRIPSAPMVRVSSKNGPGEAGDGSDLFAPTVRERRPSMSLLSEPPAPAQHLDAALRSASKSCLAGLEISQPSPENGHSSLTATEANDEAGLSQVQAAAKGGLVREESCSNLFLDAGEIEDSKVVSEFEDKYSLVGNGPLGEGTFGLVWRCVPKAGAAAVGEVVKERAAKIVRKSRLQPRDMRYLLGEDGEVRTHLTMKHPHIAALFEYFDEPSTVTLVLEYCRGGDLFDAIVRQSKLGEKGRGFPEPDAAIVTQHVLLALEYIHSHGVVHRDIKCENVLLAYLDVPVEQNVFKLCDFGFAAHDRGEGLTDRLGSPDTVAPEVVVGTPYSTPADLWSAGVLIYMMLSATAPFCASTDSEVLRKVRTGSYSLSGGVWDKLIVPPKNMIASLMTVNAKLRPTAREALRCEWLKDLPPALEA
mmetsp:Transcript_68698/g.201098  ORF Transcript_68698/g.201098 Transcript_68698/m.201098 type:complete len:547 (-) Transcript_68698:62-1702(-)